MSTDIQQQLEFYKTHRKKLLALRYVNFVIEWDTQTEAAPQSVVAASQQIGVIAEHEYELLSNPQFVEAVHVLYENRAQLDQVTAHEIQVMQKDIVQTQKIPKDEYAAFSQLISEAYPVYVQAKTENNFQLFCPYLEKIVQYKQKCAKWLETDTLKGYDVLLDQYEPNYTQKQYDAFFNLLREKLVPVIRKVAQAGSAPQPSWASRKFDKQTQQRFCEYLRDVMCFDKSCGVMKESEHPFTAGFGTDDVRITNHYHEDNVVSAIFSAIHETGHALYEHQCDKSLNGTLSGGGASVGMHESQSRFYENVIGRSHAFWRAHYKTLQQHFPAQLGDVTLQQFVEYVNRTECSFVRTEADELTYPLHIMLRYEVEKHLIDGTLAVADLPEFWNKKFTQYFGITPPTDTVGVLQDIHWTYGDFGYFPTYALGSAIASQLYHAMQADFDVEQSLQSGTTAQINEWLKNHVHKYGASKPADEILRLATGEDFNPTYYVQYLVEKYSK